MKTVEKDNMPYPVATSLLANPLRQLSNRMRKNCHAARAIVRVSEVVAQPIEGKLDRRMKVASGKQLLTWSKRATERRNILQRKYEDLMERMSLFRDGIVPQDPKMISKLKQMLETLTAAVNRLDTYKDACDDEYRRRTTVTPDPNKFLHPRRLRSEIPAS